MSRHLQAMLPFGAAAAQPKPQAGLPHGWASRVAFAHVQSAWQDELTGLKDVPPDAWPWALWANELNK